MQMTGKNRRDKRSKNMLRSVRKNRRDVNGMRDRNRVRPEDDKRASIVYRA